MTALQYRIYVGVAFIATILSVPLSFVLPVEVSFENGIIENTQVVILLLAAIWVLKVRSSLKWFQRFFSAGLLLIVFRELSWGRVFFPLTMKTLGPVFVAMKDYEYRVQVYVLLAIYISAMIFILIRYIPVKKFLVSSQPVAAFAVIFLTLLLNYIGEHGLIIDKACGQILEELNELILYLMLPAVAFHYIRILSKVSSVKNF